jgi:DNA-binding response OmpR family regulator
MTTPPRILVVDDDESVLQTFGKALALEGYDVRIANSPLDGLHEAALTPPDVILLDLRMPFVNGIGFLYRLRAQPGHRDTPVAIITGDSGIDDSALTELRALGAELLFKPIWLDEVLTVTRSMLARRSPEMAAFGLEHDGVASACRVQLPVRAARPHPSAS